MATTISISREMKEKLRNLGRAGDSYEDVIQKMYEITRKQILTNYLYDTTDCVTIDDARKQIRELSDG
jgi:predicted CopG family antitoxin